MVHGLPPFFSTGRPARPENGAPGHSRRQLESLSGPGPPPLPQSPCFQSSSQLESRPVVVTDWIPIQEGNGGEGHNCNLLLFLTKYLDRRRERRAISSTHTLPHGLRPSGIDLRGGWTVATPIATVPLLPLKIFEGRKEQNAFQLIAKIMIFLFASGWAFYYYFREARYRNIGGGGAGWRGEILSSLVYLRRDLSS